MPPQRPGEAAARAAGARGHARRRRRRRSPSTCARRRRHAAAISSELIADGRFREDLYYRLDVAPDRDAAAARAARGHPGARRALPRARSTRARGARCPGSRSTSCSGSPSYDWPGNVRELENLVERLVVVAGTRMVVMKDLPSPPAHTGARLSSAPRVDLPATGVDLRDPPHRARGALHRRGAGAHRRQPQSRRRAARAEPHHTRRETAPTERRLSEAETHISVGERALAHPLRMPHVGKLETVTRLTAPRSRDRQSVDGRRRVTVGKCAECGAGRDTP